MYFIGLKEFNMLHLKEKKVQHTNGIFQSKIQCADAQNPVLVLQVLFFKSLLNLDVCHDTKGKICHCFRFIVTLKLQKKLHKVTCFAFCGNVLPFFPVGV